MARSWFSLESDVVEEEFEAINDMPDAIDEAGDDMETTDVSEVSELKTSHNENASAGGVAIGENVDPIVMDPVVATESYIRRVFGLSREDLEDGVEETIVDADAIAPATDIENPSDVSGDADDDLVDVTTVNVVAPVGGTTETVIPETGSTLSSPDIVNADLQIEGNGTEIDVPIETPAEVATLEGLRRLWSTEDDGSIDVEFDVKTPNNDINFEMEGKAVTIEPNSIDEDDSEDEENDSKSFDEGSDDVETEENEESLTEDDTTEGEDEPDEENENKEEGSEAWMSWF